MNQETNQVSEESNAHSMESPTADRSFLKYIFRVLGPGLLMAGAAIGTSHIVQSTRAGADFGFQLIGLVVLINLLKYPFFEYGHRYAIATGENLLDGYKRMGRGFLYAFLLLAVVSAVASTAAVTFVTVAIVQYFVGAALPAVAWAVAIIASCIVILLRGHYRSLDFAMKPIMAILVVATAVALVAALVSLPGTSDDFVSPSPWTLTSLAFLIALMGWMPAPIEVSVFQSLWVQAKGRAAGHRVTLKDGRVDFNVGYGLSTLLALAFLSLGALGMHGTDMVLSESGGGFITQLVSVYVQLLGAWAGPVIAIAALATMYSTTLTVIDGYSRAMAVGCRLVAPELKSPEKLYLSWMGLVSAGALLVIMSFAGSLTRLIDVVTIMAFFSAPVYGYLNFRLITSAHTPAALQPGTGMRVLSWIGMIFFVSVGLTYLVIRVI